jgi:hypothetical protein
VGLVYISNLESGLNVRNALNGMFAEIYGSLTTPIIVENISGNTEISGIPAGTFIDSIAINTATNTTIKIGTSSGGNDILDSIAISGFQLIVIQTYLATLTNIFITFVSGSGPANFRFNVINNYL